MTRLITEDHNRASYICTRVSISWCELPIVVVKNLTLIKMETCVYATKSFPLRHPQPPVRPESSATPHPSTFISKTLPPRKLRCLKSFWSNLKLWRLYPSGAIYTL